MRVGVAYYPEHWDRSRWPEDVQLMREAGIRLVRLAEFAWSRMEPSEGEYSFEWLDAAIDLFVANGIDVVLGTPTAAPPAWLHEQMPDVFPMDRRRYPLGFGTRLQRCMNHPGMRQRSRQIVARMAERYGSHSGVIGWQTDNEFTANLCYCPTCHAQFHKWLRARYGSLEVLNAAWGTVFWSQEYTSWSQIPLPWQAKCDDAHNPSLQLAYRRFQSESTVAFQEEQLALIRQHSRGQFITHNFMGMHDSMDYYALARGLDLVSWDNYPNTPWWVDETGAGFAADVMRGLKQRNFWVMEQQNGIAGWATMGRRVPDAQLRCWAWQTVAHGADAVFFFRWRSCRFGTEQYWHGILNHDGKPRGRYREVQRFAQELARLSPDLAETSVVSEVAILNGYDQHFALQIQPQAQGLAFWEQASRYYRALRRMGLNVDVVPIAADLHRYRVVVLPSWCILTDTEAERLREYVRLGGRLVASPRTGSKTPENSCVDAPLPGALRDVFGIEVDDYDPLGQATCGIRDKKGNVYAVSVWADAIDLDGAEARAKYVDGDFRDRASLTRHGFGKGAAWYFGTYGEAAFYETFLGEVLVDAGVRTTVAVPDGVDMCVRESEHAKYLFLLNLTPKPTGVRVPCSLTPLVGAPLHDGMVSLAPHSVNIYRLSMKEPDDHPRGQTSRLAKKTVPIPQ